jgi:hypothetical protein
MKNGKQRRETAKKLIFSPRFMAYAASVLTLALIISAASLAWFNYRRALQTMTEIHSPVELNIGAGNTDAISRLDLGDIDVENATEKSYVFCVYGIMQGKYVLQLAHTTNIPFTYAISHATAATKDDYDVAYTAENGRTYYYKKTTAVAGEYLNMSGSIAGDDYHETTYGEYSAVQKNAEPLYWQTGALDHSVADDNNRFVDYYILTISWDEGAKNDKETDMVYLTAGRSGT